MTFKPPVTFSPAVEQVEADEAETVGELQSSFKQILDTTSANYGHGVRAVHAKAHGIATGRFTVAEDLPPELAQGLFAHAASYDAVIRISTNPGDILPDTIGLPRGLALKLVGVSGDRLPGAQGEGTQDFILVNGPTFTAPDAKAFAGNLKLLAKTTDRAEGGKTLVSGILRGIEATLEAVGLPSPTLQQLGGAPNVHPLGEIYWSQTPFLYGTHIAKFQLVPVSPALTALTGDIVPTKGHPDALREAVQEVLATHGGAWEFRVQLNRDLDAMPVEDPTQEWKEADSPFVTVGRLEVPPQPSWHLPASVARDDRLAFNIWHGLAAHRPLGGINRARKDPYEFSADYRGRVNGCPMHQIATIEELA